MSIDVHDEVGEALASGAPVVALESTILAHGLPSPTAREVAQRLDDEIRSGGAVPALIAVREGVPTVGVSVEDVDWVIEAPDKLSASDLGPAIAAGSTGATTVSATMAMADAVGIQVFATGGIGGVHPGAGEHFDVSADISALAAYRVAVVSSGAKAILDLAATLEALESHRVPVIGYGTSEFPAFYSRSSGLSVPHRFDGPDDVAAALVAHWALPRAGGALVANPPPIGAALAEEEVAALVAEAQIAARDAQVTGKDLTPFLLDRLATASDGKTVIANIELVSSNAKLGAEIAVALSEAR